MARILLRKLASCFLSILSIVAITFLLMQAIPGDPFQQEQALPDEIYQALKRHYGLNEPMAMQFWHYLSQLFTFDFGPSLIFKGRTVTQIIFEGFPTSAFLGVSALLIALPMGIAFGIAGALLRERWQAGAVMLLTMAGISIPGFILATLLQYVVGIKLKLLPIAQWGSYEQVILPALTLAALPAAFIARLIRSKLAEELQQAYVTTARAKGLGEMAIMIRHVLKNSLMPVISYIAPLVAGIMTGSFIIEKIFSIPGLGYWFVTSVANRDYPLIMGVTVFYCILLLLMSFLGDVITLALDPRIAAAAKQSNAEST